MEDAILASATLVTFILLFLLAVLADRFGLDYDVPDFDTITEDSQSLLVTVKSGEKAA